MKANTMMTDEALLSLVGERLAGLRLARNLTQQQVAEQAGLGLRTLQRLEQGEAATQLTGFFRVCRVLGLVENLDAFLPEPGVSPMARLKQVERKRKRATSTKTDSGTSEKWTWGESV